MTPARPPHQPRPADAVDAIRLKAEVRKLRAALKPFADHSYGGWDTLSRRRYSIRVTEGQVARAWRALNDPEWAPWPAASRRPSSR